MLAGYRLLPSFYVEKLGLAIYPLELECLRIYPLALHLAAYDRSLESHDAQVMSVGSLHDDKVSGLYALTGTVTVDTFPCILETDFKIVLVLLLVDAGKPVIHFQLAASLTIVAINLSAVKTFYSATS
jgi:hypothetical protein